MGMIGNRRLQTFPLWEMVFRKVPSGTYRIATSKAKWDVAYQKKMGIAIKAASNIPVELAEKMSPRECTASWGFPGTRDSICGWTLLVAST